MKPGIFMAGTDTDVGKTMAAAALVGALRGRGLDAGYLKPVSSDGRMMDGRLVSPDAVRAAELAGLSDPWPELNPICLPHPLSPLAAARLEGVPLAWDQVLAKLAGAGENHAFTLWEGVGGVLAPIAEGRTCLDLMVHLSLPVLVTARPLLGTINHTLLTLEAVRSRGLKALGFIFSGPPPDQADDPAQAQNAGLISEFSGAPFLGALPWLENPDAADLARAVEENLDLGPILAAAGGR